jgi:hypothetical protein
MPPQNRELQLKRIRDGDITVVDEAAEKKAQDQMLARQEQTLLQRHAQPEPSPRRAPPTTAVASAPPPPSVASAPPQPQRAPLPTPPKPT